MKKKIITISREFGSGGRTIGRQVAQELGFEFYDKELIEKVAEESGFDKQYIEEQGDVYKRQTLLTLYLEQSTL